MVLDDHAGCVILGVRGRVVQQLEASFAESARPEAKIRANLRGILDGS
jgi:hypothetical protein